MAQQDQDQDKTEKPTPFKLKEAKGKGQVTKSMEFNSFMILVVFLATLMLLAEGMITKLLSTNTTIFLNAHSVQFDIQDITQWLSGIFYSFFNILAPMFITLVIVAVLMNILQTGPIFTFFPLKPDMQRINPVSGFKRVFSMKMLFEAFKSILKLGILGSVVYLMIISQMPRFLQLMVSHPDNYSRIVLVMVVKLVMALVAVIFIIAILDLIYTRWDFMKKMMMSHRELKDEYKRREGDPKIRAKIKEVQQEAAKRNSSLSKVPDADVLITNPTHLAIAVQYDKTRYEAPVVLAKGAGELAKKMKLFAKKKNIPVIENKKLARAIFRETGIDSIIEEEHFSEVAKILIWAYSISGKMTMKGQYQVS